MREQKKTRPTGGTVERERWRPWVWGTPILFILLYHGPGLYAREAVINNED